MLTTTPLLAPPYNATLLERHDFTPELARFRIRPADGGPVVFESGQYCTLGLATGELDRRGGPKLVRRAYSIASSPNEREYLEFYIVRVEGGQLTPRLWRLSPGDPLFMDVRCKGHFTLDGVPTGRDVVGVCTGTGLAPFLSMLGTHRGRGRWRRFVLIHGARYARDLGYREELEALAAADPAFVYLPIVTREPEGPSWPGLRGRVHAVLDTDRYRHLVGVPLDPATTHVFLCGNPAMIDECQANLEARGFVTKGRQAPEGNLYFERYW